MKVKKSTVFVILSVAALCAVVLTYFMKVGTVTAKPISQTEQVSDNSDKIQSADGDVMYMLKSYYGNIGIYIFADGKYSLISVADMDIYTLPNADLAALKEGIYLNNKEDMLKLLEDYTS